MVRLKQESLQVGRSALYGRHCMFTVYVAYIDLYFQYYRIILFIWYRF